MSYRLGLAFLVVAAALAVVPPARANPLIDVLVVYTAAAEDGAGGAEEIELLAQAAVDETNDAYGRSGVQQRVRLVGTEEVAYAESGVSRQDLIRVVAQQDGHIDPVHGLRDRYGADIVVLVVEELDQGGRANQMAPGTNWGSLPMAPRAFAVVKRSALVGHWLFAHELGHVMGAGHTREHPTYPGPGSYSYSFGYKGPGHVRTIMASFDCTPSCPRVGYFSNPAVEVLGQPIGVPGAVDNASTLNQNAATVAGFRPAQPLPPILRALDPLVGFVDPAQGQWYLGGESGQFTEFFFGDPNDVPVIGDWDCDGVDTPGMFRQSDGFVYLSNANRSQIADIRFFFGNPGDVPLAGDFDGDGCDTVSLYRPDEGRFYIVDELGENGGGLGAADADYRFGDLGDKPFAGDFDGDGVDTLGLHRESTGLVYFRQSHTQGVADAAFVFGNAGDRLLAEDWDGDGVDTVGVYRPAVRQFFWRNSHTTGVADGQFYFGNEGWLPLAGHFGLARVNSTIDLDPSSWARLVEGAADRPVLVGLWASGCTNCDPVDEHLDTVHAALGDRLIVGKLDVSTHRSLVDDHEGLVFADYALFQGGVEKGRIRLCQPARPCETISPADLVEWTRGLLD